MGNVLDFFAYKKSPGSPASGSLTNKAKVSSQKEFRNKASGEFLRRKLGEIKFKDGTYQGLELRKRIEQIYGKRGYSKTSEYQFTEDLRKAGVKEKERIKVKKLWRSTFAKQQEENIVSPKETQRRVREGQISSQMADEKKISGEAIINGIKNEAKHRALGIRPKDYRTSILDSSPPAGGNNEVGSKATNKPLGVAPGLGSMNQSIDKFSNIKGIPPIGFRK